MRLFFPLSLPLLYILLHTLLHTLFKSGSSSVSVGCTLDKLKEDEEEEKEGKRRKSRNLYSIDIQKEKSIVFRDQLCQRLPEDVSFVWFVSLLLFLRIFPSTALPPSPHSSHVFLVFPSCACWPFFGRRPGDHQLLSVTKRTDHCRDGSSRPDHLVANGSIRSSRPTTIASSNGSLSWLCWPIDLNFVD